MATLTRAITNPKKASRSHDWHKADIICTLWKKGTSVRRLSSENNYTPTTLGMVLYRPWPKAERIIANAIGAPPHEIWPSRYREDGTPKSKRGERGLGRFQKKHSTGAGVVNGDVAKAP